MTHDPKTMPDDPDERPVPRTMRERLAARLGMEPLEQPMPETQPPPASPSTGTQPHSGAPSTRVEAAAPQRIDPSKIAVPKSTSHDGAGALMPAIQAPAEPPPFSPKEETRRLQAKHPLVRFSLREHADELDSEAADTKRLLGHFVMDGQATMIYAPPNTGKTLIILYLILKAIEEGLIDPNRVIYFNADDGSRGLAHKVRLLADAGAHMVAPGRRGLKIKHLVETMLQAVAEGSARGTLLVIDTLKKLADPMSKKESSEFAQVCREYVMAGGTIVALGHTRKNPNADGSYQYQGTTDIKEDFDAVYIAQLLEAKTATSPRVVQFKMEKKRADSPDKVFYAYAADAGLSYEEKLVSVCAVDPDELDDYITVEKFSHPDVMAAISRLIEDGEGEGQMALMRRAAKAAAVSERIALRVLQEFTGSTPGVHLWNFCTGARGVRRYEMIPQG